MCRANKILLMSGSVIFFILLVGFITDNKDLMVVSLISIVGIMILYQLLYDIYDSAKRKKKRFVKKVENVYNLNILDDVENEIYAAYLSSEVGRKYVFVYNCKGNNILKISSNVKQHYKDKDKVPYVEVCKNIYEPKGLMDWLFYSKRIAKEERDKIYYILYVNMENIRFSF